MVLLTAANRCPPWLKAHYMQKTSMRRQILNDWSEEVKDTITHFFTASDRELLEGSDVINKKIHQSKLITESNTDVQP